MDRGAPCRVGGWDQRLGDRRDRAAVGGRGATAGRVGQPAAELRPACCGMPPPSCGGFTTENEADQPCCEARALSTVKLASRSLSLTRPRRHASYRVGVRWAGQGAPRGEARTTSLLCLGLVEDSAPGGGGHDVGFCHVTDQTIGARLNNFWAQRNPGESRATPEQSQPEQSHTTAEWTIAWYPVSHGIPNMCHGNYHGHQGRFPIATGGFCLALASRDLCVGGAQPPTACLKDAHNFGIELTDFQYPFGIIIHCRYTICNKLINSDIIIVFIYRAIVRDENIICTI